MAQAMLSPLHCPLVFRQYLRLCRQLIPAHCNQLSDIKI